MTRVEEDPSSRRLPSVSPIVSRPLGPVTSRSPRSTLVPEVIATLLAPRWSVAVPLMLVIEPAVCARAVQAASNVNAIAANAAESPFIPTPPPFPRRP